jgi:hypothetical protein
MDTISLAVAVCGCFLFWLLGPEILGRKRIPLRGNATGLMLRPGCAVMIVWSGHWLIAPQFLSTVAEQSGLFLATLAAWAMVRAHAIGEHNVELRPGPARMSPLSPFVHALGGALALLLISLLVSVVDGSYHKTAAEIWWLISVPGAALGLGLFEDEFDRFRSRVGV